MHNAISIVSIASNIISRNSLSKEYRTITYLQSELFFEKHDSFCIPAHPTNNLLVDNNLYFLDEDKQNPHHLQSDLFASAIILFVLE